MKRLNRQEMLDIVATLQKANRLAVAAGAAPEQVIAILTKCQDSAITLGEALERYGEVGEQIIHMLEEYCEALYQQSQFVGNAEIQREFQSGIAALLGLVEDKLKKELPEDKKVVVFLPYKAAMWDALEGVWKAAEEDPDCDAYVVPIPYFDRNPDRSFGEMHYEGDQYPDYVPVYSWEEFNLPDMKPDMVFIHNPYDEYNYVTSIHPAFYVPELRKYAKEIIYIPYFVIGEIDITKPEAEEKMRMFALQPGVLSTDKVIVESEQVKDAYVHVLVKEYGEEHRHVWEEKILPLGSPKFDKINSTTEEDFEIPEEWKPVLYKEDGSRRKTILYNTSVSALLKHDEKMLVKMRNVFQTFYENRDEVALLWRPHPLIKATIESLRPNLWEEYEKIVNEYRGASWGIYDDTSDLNRAIELADAYYGDGSSLVKLCQEKGMFVGLQKFGEEEDVLCEKIFFLDAVRRDDEIWFSSNNGNGIFRADINFNEIRLENVFEEEYKTKEFPYSKILSYKEKLIFVPFQAKKIAVYNCNGNKVDYVELENTEKVYSLFYTAIQVGECIYMIPCRYNKMIKYNVENDEVQYIDIFGPINDLIQQSKEPYIFKAACVLNETLFVATYTDNYIIMYNMLTGNIKLEKIPFEEKGISHLAEKEGVLYAFSRYGMLCRWDLNSDIKSIKMIEEGNEYQQTFFDAKVYKNYIFLTGVTSGKLYVYDIKKQSVENIVIVKKENKENKKFYGDMYLLFCNDDKVYTISMWSNKLLEYDISSMEVIEKDVVISSLDTSIWRNWNENRDLFGTLQVIKRNKRARGDRETGKEIYRVL